MMDKPLCILIVDDNQDMTKTLVKVLSLQGYEAVAANTGQQAFVLAQENNFDCVISDIKMPGMSGVELLQNLMKSSPQIPVILMTAYEPSLLLSASAARHVVAVLSKPLDFDLLFMYLSALK